MKQLIILLTFVALSVWISVFSVENNLQVIACDVGQGDAILIQHKNNQILIDGGPDKKVLDCLGRHMPFWDRQIEMVILTHPDLDHFGGLIDVFKNYKVLKFGNNGQDIGKPEYEVLKEQVGGMEVDQLALSKGMVIRLGLIHLDVLHPKQRIENSKTQKLEDGNNDNSIVLVLDYLDFEAIFTGDVENKVSDEISKNEKVKDLDYIKVNHHGSRNGMTENLLKTVNPTIAVISAGFKNRYGHPHAEIIELLQKYNIKILRTDETGDVIVVTDGKTFKPKK